MQKFSATSLITFILLLAACSSKATSIGEGASGSTLHPVSIEAYMEKDFNGSDLQLGNILAQNEVYTRYSITYRSGNLTISGIMNIPNGTGSFPVIILNHGFADTTQYKSGGGLKNEQDYLARKGYVVVHPDFRNHALSDKDENAEIQFRLGYAEDAINAILAVKAARLPNIDTQRVGMLGHSMGGGVTLNALVIRPDIIDAAVLYVPVTGSARAFYEKWTWYNFSRARAIRSLYGSPRQNPEFWDAVSAINYLDRITGTVMIHHGTADRTVPLQWSRDLNERLTTLGKDSTFHTYEGEKHLFEKDWQLLMERSMEFFDAQLKVK